MAIFVFMDEFTFPVSFSLQSLIGLVCIALIERKACFEKGMADAAQGLLRCPSIEFFGTTIPENNAVNRVADQNSVVRQIHQFSLQAKLLQTLRVFALNLFLCRDIAHGGHDMWCAIQNQRAETDIDRELQAILVLAI